MSTFAGDGIHTHFQLIQHIKTGEMDENEIAPQKPPEFDIFLGEGMSEVPMAKIQSNAFSSRPAAQKKHNHYRFRFGKEAREQRRHERESGSGDAARYTGD